MLIIRQTDSQNCRATCGRVSVVKDALPRRGQDRSPSGRVRSAPITERPGLGVPSFTGVLLHQWPQGWTLSPAPSLP